MRLGGRIKFKDFEKIEQDGKTIGHLVVYRDSSEEYAALISVEAAESLEAYLDSRRKVREVLTAKSPILRDLWDSSGDHNENGESTQNV